MTTETALWIVGAIVVPAIGWAIHITYLVMKTKTEVGVLLKMHREPDKYGFGTLGTNENLKENTRAVRSLTHYFKWFIAEQMEKDPPPPLEGGATVVD